ncbi:hypothetical protein PIB30_063326, partial [Stylosanthes scabra]|nr:hypothetical protein [Stylosanthes scabra]
RENSRREVRKSERTPARRSSTFRRQCPVVVVDPRCVFIWVCFVSILYASPNSSVDAAEVSAASSRILPSQAVAGVVSSTVEEKVGSMYSSPNFAIQLIPRSRDQKAAKTGGLQTFYSIWASFQSPRIDRHLLILTLVDLSGILSLR